MTHIPVAGSLYEMSNTREEANVMHTLGRVRLEPARVPSTQARVAADC